MNRLAKLAPAAGLVAKWWQIETQLWGFVVATAGAPLG